MSSRFHSSARSLRPIPQLQRSTKTPGAPPRNAEGQFHPKNLFVPGLVAAVPAGLALLAGTEVLSYDELNLKANQIANCLIGLGAGAERLVALCLDRSMMAVVCALGVLRSGAAYLPLDPSYPTERLNFLLNDARPSVLITTQEMEARLPAGTWEVIAIDRDIGEISRLSAELPDIDLAPENLAYVIYTSGSTGQPKGVEVTHANLMNLVAWHQDAFEVTAQDRASLLAGVGFDASVWEVWPYLTAGASLHLPDEDTRLSPESLRDWLIANQITVSFLPTALAERVMALDWTPHPALRFLLTGAETLHRFPSHALPFTVVNNYGPTECTVVATSGTVPTGSNSNRLPTIGLPVTNAEIHLLDQNLQPVPAGADGEVYIGGAGVARGYLNQAELTAERFIPNPFSADLGARLYRSGDLAHRLDSGELAYVGRIDEQIKILGHRIEPTEIVAVLNRHPAIQSSVLVADGEACTEKRLVAYIVLNRESSPAAAELRTFLQNELPGHMVPSVFVPLEELPLNKNGKVDRAALPAPDFGNTMRDEVFIAPRTRIEEKLSVMICSLLGLDQVSINDNFFMLGGHSLLGTQLIAQIRNRFGVELPLRTIFEAPTIENLSLQIEQLVMARVEAMSEEEVQCLLA